jgi:hypothetical protein
MASLQEIRQRLGGQRIETLRSRIEPLLAAGLADDPCWRGLCRDAIRLQPTFKS